MKQLKRTILCLLTALMLMSQTAAADNGKQADSIRISLLTCMPRPYVYSLYGHTAIRYENLTQGIDIAINYGIFSFSKPYFVLRFVFGLTDYEMGIEYFEDFKAQYERSGCGVIQQTLNLTDKEKTAIAKAIDKNYLPENRVYRYNYFYDNCTTRARDIILDNINGKVVFENEANPYPSFRELIHQYNERHRWARFGNDLLLGVKADRPTTFGEQQFLPKNLSKDINHAVIYDKDGSKRKFVESETWVLPVTSDSGSQFPHFPNRVPGSVGGISRCHNDNRGYAESKLLVYRHDNDVLNRSMRTDFVCHDFLATPHREPQSADSAAQSAEPCIPVEHIQEDKERTAQ